MIYFIGIHHKPGLPALCSTTRSGKRIDAVIDRLIQPCKKDNLFSSDRIPNEPSEYEKQLRDFIEKINDGDTLVLLGGEVQKRFPLQLLKRKVRIVCVRHPAFSPTSFVDDLVSLLL